MLNISSGKINRAQKVVIYGSEGIGKSTLAAQFPAPLFIDTEGGTSHLDVRRVDKPETWDGLISIVKEVAKQPEVCKTLVLDTADWAEQLAIAHICDKFKKAGLEEFGFGKGYTYLSEEFHRLLDAFDLVIAAGIHVVVTAHAKMRKFEQPDEMGAYDRWEMKLSKQVAPLLKEWSDLLLFLNYKTYVVAAQNDKKKAQGGKRVIYTSHHPCWDAKNRCGLPEEIDLGYAGIRSVFETETVKAATAPTGDNPRQTLIRLMDESGIVDEELRDLVAKKGHFKYEVTVAEYPDAFISEWVIPNWKKIVETIEANPHRLPF